MTPDEADLELWKHEPAVPYSTLVLLDRLEKSVRKALEAGYQEFVWSVWQAKGALLIVTVHR